jgi:hypothetical protein
MAVFHRDFVDGHFGRTIVHNFRRHHLHGNVFYPVHELNLFTWGRLYKTLNHFFNHYFVVK